MDIITVQNTKDIPTMHGENYALVDPCEEFSLQDYTDALAAEGKQIGSIYLLKGTGRQIGSVYIPAQDFYYVEVK